MRESYIKLFGAKYPITWRSYVWRVVIGHALVLIGWPIIAFLTTGNWLHRWQLGLATATVPAALALAWGYFRKTKPQPLDPEFEAKLQLLRALERKDIRKLHDLPAPAADRPGTEITGPQGGDTKGVTIGQELSRLMDPPNIQYEVLPTRDQRILLVIDALQKKFLNGGVILRSFRPLSKLHVDPSFRPDLVGIEHDLICLLQAESVRSAVPELQIPFPLENLPRYTYYNAFEFEGAVTAALLCSGAYMDSKLDEETARKMSRDFVDALSNGDRSRTRVYSIRESWTAWFYDIAWDQTFVVVNVSTGIWTLFCFTDTD